MSNVTLERVQVEKEVFEVVYAKDLLPGQRAFLPFDVDILSAVYINGPIKSKCDVEINYKKDGCIYKISIPPFTPIILANE